MSAYPAWMMEAARRFVDVDTRHAVPAHDDDGFCDQPDCYWCEIRRPTT
jgi:hypothetical protein